MTAGIQKLTPHERRRGENALSEFADYVERQQPKYAAAQKKAQVLDHSGTNAQNDHSELDILDTLHLSDDSRRPKLKELLVDHDDDQEARTEDLIEVVKARLLEGGGESIFDLGQEDNGDSMDLDKDQWNHALSKLRAAAEILKAECQILMTRNVGGTDDTNSINEKDKSCTGKVMIRQEPETAADVMELRIAVVGNVDAGKSTMLGVLVKGGLDDGRGKARVNLFRHKHEIESGRTSSVGMEIMGFDTKGTVVTSKVAGRKLSWEEIGQQSAKVISFSDLAGHERYLRTTVFGLLSSSPNYCLLMIAANNGLIGMSKEHLGIAMALNVPVMVVITKIDICPPHVLQETISQLSRILKSPGARKIPIFIKSRRETIETASQFVSQRICPVFQVSNVTGESLDLVRLFLNLLPVQSHYDTSGSFEFHVNDTFSVPFVGTVVSGIVSSGIIHAGDTVLIGPDSLGQFTTTSIRTIERKRIQVPLCQAGQSASFALKKVRKKEVRKGMVVLPKPEIGAALSAPKVYREFVAEVLILSHATTIMPRYQAMLHVGPIQQTCAIIAIDRAFIRTGDRATVAFRFVQRPEYLTVGERILFREGRTKGLGIVKALGYDEAHPLNAGETAKSAANGGNAEKGKGDA